MKFSFYTDSHLSGKKPIHRTDSYASAVPLKMKEIYEVSEDEDCEFILFGGDFFHTHRIFNFDLIGDVMDVISSSKLKTYGCIGEHDLYGHSPDSYASSTLAFVVRRCDNFKLLWEPEDLGNVVLYGKHEWMAMEEVREWKLDNSKINIMACHELLTNKTDNMFTIYPTSKLTGLDFDLVASGDLHCGYRPHEVDGTWFCNPGCLGRRSSADDHPARFAIVEIDEDGLLPPKIEYRNIMCASNHKDIFDKTLVEIVAERKTSSGSESGSRFAKELEGLSVGVTDIHELVKKVGEKMEVGQAVLDYLDEKRVDLEKGDSE